MAFAEPLAFAFTALVGVLVALYLWERRRPVVIVPSLMLWTSLREDKLRSRRLRPDLLFVLQLLALVALILGLSRPFWRGGPAARQAQRHVLIVDTSASMQTREAAGTRIEQAIAAARSQLAETAAEDEVMLINAGSSTEVTVPLTRQHQQVRAALDQLRAADVHGELTGAVSFAVNLAQRSDRRTMIKVFSDWPRSQLPPELRDRVTLFQVGTRQDNVAIESLDVLQGRFQNPTDAALRVGVRNFGPTEAHGWLQVSVADQSVLRSGFTLAAGATKSFSIANPPRPGAVIARLDADDGFSADDVAFGWLHAVPATRILVVTAASPLVDDLQALAKALPSLQLTVAAPDAIPSGSFDVALFHKVITRQWPEMPSLFIDPPAGNPLLPANGEEEHLEVIDWNASHPVLRDLRPLTALPLQRAGVFTPPPWAQTLLWSRTGTREIPLVFAGEHGGHRTAVIAFDLEAEHLLRSDTLGFFLVFLRLLEWLAPQPDEAIVAHTGDAITFDAGSVTQVDGPGGIETKLTAVQRGFVPLRAGEYVAHGPNGDRRWLVNFTDAAESAIARPAIEAPRPTAIEALRPSEDTVAPTGDFGAWLLLAAAVLLLTEWLAWRRSPA